MSPCPHVATSPRYEARTSSRRDVGVFDSNIMSSHIGSNHVTSRHSTSHHVTSQHLNVATFWVRMNNVATLEANVATSREIYDQCHDVGHEHRDVAGFSNDKKVTKIQSLGLLHTSKLFLLHIFHPRSSHDHILQEQHWI